MTKKINSKFIMFLILKFSICSRKSKLNTCIIKIKYMHHIKKIFTFDLPEIELATIPPRRGKRQIGRSPWPFLDDSHRRRRRLIIQQNHRSGEISPFAEERKETERDVTVFLGGGEQQIERPSLAIVDDSHPLRRSRGVEQTHRSHRISPFVAARREEEIEK